MVDVVKYCSEHINHFDPDCDDCNSEKMQYDTQAREKKLARKKLPFEIDEVGVVTGDADACRDWIRTLPVPPHEPDEGEVDDPDCHGVDIFQVGKRDHEFEIERCDECGRFDDDLQAIRWLRNQKALAEREPVFTTFHNLRISIGTRPGEAYDLLTAALKKIQDDEFISVDWESSTFSVNDGEEKDTVELFPRPGSAREMEKK